VKFNELLKKAMQFLRSLVARYRNVESYFEVLEKTAESAEARNTHLTERIELKKREFVLKQRIQTAKNESKKLEAEYQEYDPKASTRRTWKIYGLLTLGMILFFMLLKACTGC